MTEHILRTIDRISDWSGKLFAWLILILTIVVLVEVFLEFPYVKSEQARYQNAWRVTVGTRR